MRTLPFFLLIVFCNALSAQDFNPRKTDTINIPIGKIGKHELVYDCSDCHQMYSGGINVFYKNKTRKHFLFTQEIADFYVDEVSLVKIEGNYFIYVNSSHTYGHSQGYLFYLNDKTMKAYNVKLKSKQSKLPANANIHKHFDLTRDRNGNFGFGATIRVDGQEDEVYEGGKYRVKKVRENEFVLVDAKKQY